MANRVGMVLTKGRARSIASGKFRGTYFGEFREMRICGMKRFELSRRLEIYFNGGDNINMKNEIDAHVNRVPGTPNCIGVQ